MFQRFFLALLAAGVIGAPAVADGSAAGHLLITHPWSRPTAEGQPVGVAYLSITNNGRAADVLLRASTPVAGSVQMHQTIISGGMARMRTLEELVIAPGKTVKIEPGGIHLMLMDLKEALVAGSTVPLTLELRAAGKITVMLQVE